MKWLLVAFLTLVVSIGANADEPTDQTGEKNRIGTMVLEIEAALKAPGDPKSLDTIAKYGTETRFYLMIRGWLIQLKTGTQSQVDSASDPALKAKHRKMNDFLAKAIRRIDLE